MSSYLGMDWNLTLQSQSGFLSLPLVSAFLFLLHVFILCRAAFMWKKTWITLHSFYSSSHPRRLMSWLSVTVRIPWKEILLCQAWSGDCLWPMRELGFPVQTWLLGAPHGALAGSFLRRGLASGLCRQFKRVWYNKKKATQDLDTNILDSKQEMLGNAAFIVCVSRSWMIRLRGKVTITIDAQQVLRGEDAKVILWDYVEVNNEIPIVTFCFPVYILGIVEHFL